MYIANHNAPSITDFIRVLSIECMNRRWLKTNNISSFFPMRKILLSVLARALTKKDIKIFSKNDRRLVMIATEIVKDGLLNSTEPGADEKQEGWYNTQSKYWKERVNILI